MTISNVKLSFWLDYDTAQNSYL